MADIGSALIDAGSSVLSAITGGLFGSSSTKKQFAQAKELMHLQHDLNSPVQMSKDLRAAGFNPAMMIGESHSVNGNTSLGSPPDAASAMSAGSQLVNNAALLSAHIRNLNSQTDKNEAEAGKTALEQQYQKIQNEYLPKLLTAQLTNTEKDSLLKEMTAGLNKEQSNKVRSEVDKIEKEKEMMDKEIELYVERIKQASSEAEIADMRKNMTPDLLEAELSKYFADISQAKAAASQLSALANNINKDSEIKEVQKQIQDIVLAYTPSIQNAELQGKQVQNQLSAMERNRAAAGNKAAIFMAPFAEVMGSIGRVFSGSLNFSSGKK